MRALTVLALACTACGGAAAIQERALDPQRATPIAIEHVALPKDAKASAAWAGPSGDALVALRDGRLFAIDARGRAMVVERAPDDPATPDEGPIVAFAVSWV